MLLYQLPVMKEATVATAESRSIFLGTEVLLLLLLLLSLLGLLYCVRKDSTLY